MKQINGTITLSFLEEDNQQRVIFRVVPLCTREGAVFRDKPVEFPDQGSLRIVPDKREQSTFKERMRSMGNLCVIQLCCEGKELAKVRQNRNYDPVQGEMNQFAIYSDVVCEFTADGVFEVFAEGVDSGVALTPSVLFRRGQVLYGPVDKGIAPNWESIKPFGNDSYLLHGVEMQDGTDRTFYWNPELTITWRQRRGTLRRNKVQMDDETETNDHPQDEAASENVPAVAKKVDPVTENINNVAAATDLSAEIPVAKRAVRRETAPMQTTVKAEESVNARSVSQRQISAEPLQPAQSDTALPIGAKLNILDESITFEEQISKLDQPLSHAANLLASASSITPAAPERAEAPVRFNGTPLSRMGVQPSLPIRTGEALHYVVERQIRNRHEEHSEQGSEFKHIENPIENLNLALDKVWETPETREQAFSSLCNNKSFMQQFLRHLQLQGRELSAVRAAQEQLEDIEAERLSLLMQLEAAKNDHKQAVEAMYGELARKKRDELTQLDKQLAELKLEKERLIGAIAVLADETQRNTLDWLLENDLQICASHGQTYVLAPTVGVYRTATEMIPAVCVALNRQGFACNEDDATELLLHFALNDEICLCGDTLAEAELCAHTLLDALGLLGVTARTDEHSKLEIASLLPANGLRTPTAEVCPMGRLALKPFGHKTIRIMGNATTASLPLPIPVVYTPVFHSGIGTASTAEPVRPVSLESFMALREEALPLLEQGEAWFNDLESKLAEQRSALAGIVTQQMRVFVSAASKRLRGGFIAAADAAMLCWVVPGVFRQELNPEPLRQEICALPRCLAALGIH